MKNSSLIPRRDWLIGTSASLAATAFSASAVPAVSGATPEQQAGDQNDRTRRMQWWHEAKFGMFIHWGLYSVLGRHEWAMEEEGIPVAEYQLLAKRFNPKP